MTKEPAISLKEVINKGHSPSWWKSFASGTRATASVTANVALGDGGEGSTEPNNDFAMSLAAVHKTDQLKCITYN